MAISYVSGASAASNTVAMPTHTTGDLIFCFAFRDGNVAAPTAPAGWTVLDSIIGGTSCSSTLGYKYAASGSETTGTWTNASGVVVVVYRGCYYVGGSAVQGYGVSSSITHPDTGVPYYNNTLWSVRFCGHRSATNLGTNAPSGYTARAGTATECYAFDNSSFTAATGTQAQSVSASSGWNADCLQLIDASTVTTPVGNFYDDFNTGSTPDSSKWRAVNYTGGTVSLSSGQLLASATSTAGSQGAIVSQSMYTFAGSSVSFKVNAVSLGTYATAFGGFVASRSSLGWVFLGTTAQPSWNFSDGAFIYPSTMGSALTHVSGYRYRIRESGGTTYWDYSTNNGLSWVNQFSEATGATPRTSYPELSAKHYEVVAPIIGASSGIYLANAGTAYFDDLNPQVGGKGAFFTMF